MDGPTGQLRQRTLTPAVLASALFVAASFIFSVTFVAGRGSLDMPVASPGRVAVVTPGPSLLEPTAPPQTPGATPMPGTLPPPTSAPPTAAPTDAPTPAPTVPAPTLDPDDPLLALPECPDHPGCHLYVVQRFDTMSGVVSRYLLSLTVVLALNPQISDPSVIVTGQTLYLGRSPFVRLDPCPDQPACSLYVVASGDSLAAIAVRFGLTVEQIRDQNPGMPRPLSVGQVIELPHPA